MSTNLKDSANDSTETPAVVVGSADASSEAVLEEEVLVEEISIDGMCGVY